MKLQIKSLAGSVLFEGDFSSIAEMVKSAVAKATDLRSADLRSADLYSADLRSANLYGADLRSADLRSANLYSADLRSADLRSADLRSADLRSANLRSADLRGANLRSANLYGADLRGANLRSANLYSADLRGANLTDVKFAELAIAQTRILPEGDVIGWKKLEGGLVAKLLIPAAAKRSHAFGRKCRAEYAQVLEIWNGAQKRLGPVASQHDGTFKYSVGETVRPTASFDDDWKNECAPGIHFYITRIEAENH